MKNRINSGVLARFVYFNAFLVLGIYFHAAPLRAQLPVPDSAALAGASATITFANGTSIKLRSGREKFRPVALLPGETVDIQLKLPRRFVDTPVAVQALDGGVVTEDVMVAADGRAAIAFQAGVQPGLYRILLSARSRSALLRFWVPNREVPDGD